MLDEYRSLPVVHHKYLGYRYQEKQIRIHYRMPRRLIEGVMTAKKLKNVNKVSWEMEMMTVIVVRLLYDYFACISFASFKYNA